MLSALGVLNFAVRQVQSKTKQFCQLEKPYIWRHLQILGMLSDDGLNSLGTYFLVVYAKCYVGISLGASQSYATGFSITFLILNHSLEMISLVRNEQ